MSRQVTLSTLISVDLKKALTTFCKTRGLKIQTIVENAIRERLEDEMDLAAFEKRKDEEETKLAKVMEKLKK